MRQTCSRRMRKGHNSSQGGAVTFKVILELGYTIGYTVYVPALPCCIHEGEKALQHLREAIEFALKPSEEPCRHEGQLLDESAG